jgi:HMG (high mobility group) box
MVLTYYNYNSWFRDRTKKRRHRKTHGKIAFTDLSRMVSKRWKELPEDKKAFYKHTAAKDLERYRQEIHEMESKQESAAYSSLQTPSVVIARTA